MAAAPLERFILLEGCFNFRDLGGYPARDGRAVKWRRLFRSDALDHMTEGDVEYVANTLGVVTVVDLRNPDQGQNCPFPSAQYHNIPFLEGIPTGVLRDTDQDPVERLTATYLWILRNAGERIGDALTTLAKGDSLPAVVHCSAGKDRTGVLSALVLGILGVSQKDIIEDYTTTNQVITEIIHRLSAVPGNEHLRSRPATYFQAHPKVMEVVLAEIQSVYGDAVNYVKAHGVSESTIGQLQSVLLD